jgi:competence protein ComFC
LGVEIHPKRLRGPWNEGYALDVHVLESTFIGDNEYGHPMFDTKRSPVGQLLYQLKYRHDETAVGPLIDTIQSFLGTTWRPPVDAIVPVPPSLARKNQPVMMLARALADALRIPLCTTCISKVKQTPQLKDIFDYDKRTQALKGAFGVAEEHTSGKDLLLFDDVHGSGATVRAIVELLRNEGKAKAVHLLTLTTR